MERSPGGVIVVGGDARCDVVLDGRGISGTHCRLSPMPELPGAYLLEDLASTYGTFVNSARVGRPVVVSGSDVISVGGWLLMLASPGSERAAIARLSEVAAPEQAKGGSQTSGSPPPGTGTGYDPRAPWLKQFEYFDGLARSWHDSGRPKGKLLEGSTISLAERWIAVGARQDPSPGALHRDFIEQSRNRRAFRLQISIGLSVVGVLVVVVGVAGFLYRHELQTLLVPPEAISSVEDSEDPAEIEAPSQVELQALVEVVDAQPDPLRRLLLQVAAGEVARAQGRPLLSESAWPLLRSAQGTLGEQAETVLRGHTGPVTVVGFAPDGRRIVSAGRDGSARVWDFSSPAPGRRIALRGHLQAITAAEFSPDGSTLATAGEDDAVHLWRLDAPEPSSTDVALERHESAVRVLAWHPDGQRFVSGDDDGKLVVWRVDSTVPVSVRAAHEASVTALVFDDGEPPTLWSGGDDRLGRQWAMAEDGSLTKVRTLDDHVGGVTDVAVSRDGAWAATATTAGEVLLWPRGGPTRGGRKQGTSILPPVPLEGHREAVASVAFTRDGHWLVSAGGPELRMWDLAAKDPSVSTVVLPGHTGDINTMVLAAGNRAVSGASDNQIRVWDLEKSLRVISAADLEGHTDSVRAVGVSDDGLRIVSGSEDSTVRVWDAFDASPGRGASILRVGPAAVQDYALAQSGHVLGVSTQTVKIWQLSDLGRWRTPRTLAGSEGILGACTLDAAGQWAAVGSEAGTIFVWRLDQHEPVALAGHTGSINALAFLPDGRLVSASSDRTLRVWDLSAPGQATVWDAHPDEVHALLTTPEGGHVFSGGLDGTLIRWDIEDGSAVMMPGHEGEIRQLRISADGSRLASASADRRARVWDVQSAKPLHVLRGHDEAVEAVAFSRGRWLATAGADAKILVWDLSSEHPDERPRELLGHQQTVASLAFTRDPDVLASGGNDSTVRLWRLGPQRSDVREVTMPGHGGVVAGLRLSPDGTQLISAGFDGSIRVWPLTHDTLERVVCDVVGDTLPEGEAARVLGVPVGDPCTGSTGRR